MQQQPNQFRCKACGHEFNAAYVAISKAPTCPKCRTFGQIIDSNGRTLGGQQKAARAPAGGPPPYAQRGGGYGEDENDVVEVDASVSYGRKDHSSLVKTFIMIGLGIGMVCTTAFIVIQLKGDPKEEARQKREVVQDPKDFERAIDESVGKVRNLLKAVPDAEVQETTNFDTVINAIKATPGGVAPSWSAPPKPGQPFRTHGFIIKAPVKDRNNPDKVTWCNGFIMMLYYKTSPEVSQATDSIKRELGDERKNYSIYSNPAVWYVTYGGYDYGGIVKDAIDKSMKLGAPVLRQFTDRTGATLSEDLK